MDILKQRRQGFNAKLRVCAACEWIFKIKRDSEDMVACPKCEFGSYSARYVYGDKAYKYYQTQKPWFDRKMNNYGERLKAEILKSFFDKI